MGEQVLLRTSERVAFRRCRQRWQWSYEQGLKPKSESPALAFGNLIHQALEAFYIPGRKRGIHPAKAFQQLFDSQPVHGRQWDEDGNGVESLELGIAMLNGYIDHYGKDQKYEIVEPEHKFAIDIHTKSGKYLSTIVGTFDGLAINRETGRMVLLEHKTAKSIETVTVNSQYGDQALTYTWAANIWLKQQGVLKKSQTLSTVVFNFLRKAVSDDRPKNHLGQSLNKDGSVSLKQPAPLFGRQELIFGPSEFENLERRIKGEAWEMQQARRGKLPMHKNPTNDCKWDCSFKDVCELHEVGADYQTLFDFDFDIWNPYDTYQLRKEHK